MNSEEPDELLKELIGFKTVNGNEAVIADYLENLFNKHNIKTDRLNYSDDRVTLIAEVGKGDKPVLAFDGHEDTVALGDVNTWQSDPLSGTVKEGRMYGRGSSDMKSGLAAEVLTLINLKRIEDDLKVKVRLFATIGEELGELGARQILNSPYLDDVDALVVGEPTCFDKALLSDPKFINANGIKEDVSELVATNKMRDQLTIATAHKGTFAYKVIAHGKAAHSSMPQFGRNAITDLVRFYNLQNKYFDSLREEDELLGKSTNVVTKMRAGQQLNTVPGSAEMSVIIRTIPQKKISELKKDVQKIADQLNKDGANIEIKSLMELDCMYSSCDSKLAKLAKNIGEKIFDQKLPYVGMSGGTDATYLAKGKPELPVIVFGPGNMTSSHKENEYVDLDTYHRFIQFYQHIVMEYA